MTFVCLCMACASLLARLIVGQFYLCCMLDGGCERTPLQRKLAGLAVKSCRPSALRSSSTKGARYNLSLPRPSLLSRHDAAQTFSLSHRSHLAHIAFPEAEWTATMKAAVLTGTNKPWEVQDVPKPTMNADEVLVQVRACGICFTDIWTQRGAAGESIYPITPGHEVVGEVVEVGSGVHSRKVGDRVGTTWVQRTCGRCEYCKENNALSGQAAYNCAQPRLTGFTTQGGQAEYIAITAAGTVLIPEGLSFTDAAPIFCAGYTTWSGLCSAEPKPNDVIAVNGIGGLGHLAIQFAKAAGFKTVAVTSSADKHGLCRSLGADAVVSSGAELQAMGGANVILLCSNSYQAGKDMFKGLSHDGRIVQLGLDPFSDFVVPTEARPFFAQRQKLIGATHNGFNYLNQALEMAASGRVKPIIEVFPQNRLLEAVDRVTKGNVRFRAVVTYP